MLQEFFLVVVLAVIGESASLNDIKVRKLLIDIFEEWEFKDAIVDMLAITVLLFSLAGIMLCLYNSMSQDKDDDEELAMRYQNMDISDKQISKHNKQISGLIF